MRPTNTGNLTAERDAFVGREQDLAALRAALARGERLVTVRGPAGVGKTRTARCLGLLELAALADAGGVWFCDLTQARSRDDVAAAVAAALGAPLSPEADGGDLVAQAGRALAARGRALVLLDNFEQLVAHAAETVGRWLDAAREARFVVTSRAPLALAGERVHELRPLAEADALALLEERAQRIAPGFSAADRACAAALVRRLDGLPLAIELAAGRLDVLSLAEVLERLARRFELLRGDRRDAPAHHATLRAAIASSWELLAPLERSALAQCAVFAGGFTVRDAEQVLRLGGDERVGAGVLDALQCLRRKSLLRVEEPGARLALYESVREFVREECADVAAGRDARARHAAWCLRESEWSAARTAGRDGAGHVERLAALLDDALEAQRGALEDDPSVAARLGLALDPLLATRGPFDRHVALLDATVAAAERAGDLLLRARAHLARGEARRVRAQGAPAQRDLEAALALAWRATETETLAGDGGEAPTPTSVRGDALRLLAVLDREQGRRAAACERAESAAVLLRAAGRRRLEGSALAVLGLACADLGRLDEARAHQERALAIAREVFDTRSEAMALGNLAFVALTRGRLEEARAHSAQALALWRARGERRFEGQELTQQGWAHYEAGELPEARARFEEALARHREVGYRRLEGYALSFLCAIELERGDEAAAQGWALQALAALGQERDPLREAYLRWFLGNHCQARGELGGARAHFDAALALCREADEGSVAAYALASLAALEASLDRAEEAASLLEQARGELGGARGFQPRACVEALAGVVDLALARRAVASGAPDEGHARRDAARGRLARATTAARACAGDHEPPAGCAAAACSAVVRLSVRVLRAALDDAPEPGLVAGTTRGRRDADALEVDGEGRWFRGASGARVELGQRATLRLVLRALLEHRLGAPGSALDWQALFAAGWPGERAQWEAGRNRVYAAVRALRKLGLGDALVTRAEGYLLDPEVRVERTGL